MEGVEKSPLYSLQWGRTFSSAEVRNGAFLEKPKHKLQWGRTFSSAEVGLSFDALIDIIELQWGRTFSSAEVHNQPLAPGTTTEASMGPHFFKCGSTGFNIVRQ